MHATYLWSDETPPELSDCVHPWERIDVTATGDVLVCCFAQETLGNLAGLDLDSVLSGERRARLQADVRANRINPACFNAACMYAYSSVRRPWRVTFPADRFSTPGLMSRLRGWRSLLKSERLIAEGPDRYFPTGRITARLRFTIAAGWRLPGWLPGALRVELVDEQGQVLGVGKAPLSHLGDLELVLAADLAGLGRSRLSFRIWASGPCQDLSFRGVEIEGEPAITSRAAR